MNFHLTKYLAEGKLYEEKLPTQEQDIIDDILSVTEGLNDIISKMKGYAKKGLLTVAIITSVVGQLKAQGQNDLANQVEKQSTELITTSIPKSKEFGITMPFRKLTHELDFDSKAGKFFQSQTWKKSKNQPEVKRVNINGVDYKIVRYYIPSERRWENVVKVEFTSKGQVNPNLSFFASFGPEEKFKFKTPPTSEEQIKSYEDMGYVVKQTTRAGDRSIVIMGNEDGKYVSLSFTKGKLVNKTTSNYRN